MLYYRRQLHGLVGAPRADNRQGLSGPEIGKLKWAYKLKRVIIQKGQLFVPWPPKFPKSVSFPPAFRQLSASSLCYPFLLTGFGARSGRRGSPRSSWSSASCWTCRAFGKGQMGSALMGSLQISLFLQRDFLGTPVNLLLSPQSAWEYLFPQSSKIVTFAAAHIVSTPFVRNQGIFIFALSCAMGGAVATVLKFRII